jgi:hypothetical protein
MKSTNIRLRIAGILTTIWLLALSFIGIDNFTNRANALNPDFEAVYHYSDFAADTYNIKASTFGLNRDVCLTDSVIPAHYIFEATKIGDQNARFSLETTVKKPGEFSALLTSNALQNRGGIAINCAPDGSDFNNSVALDLVNLPKNYLNFTSQYAVSLRKVTANSQVEVLRGTLRFDASDVRVLSQNNARIVLPSGSSLQYNLLDNLKNGVATTQNPSVLSVLGSGQNLQSVKLIAHRPGHATITNGLTGAFFREIAVIVRPEFGIPLVDLRQVVSLTSPEYGSEDAQFHDAIKFLFDKGITSGALGVDGKIHYFAGDKLTRGQFAALLYRFCGSPNFVSAPSDNFADTSSHQFQKEIAWLSANKIAGGVGGRFYPDANIKRGEVAKLIALTFAQDSELAKTSKFSVFTDLDENSDLTKYIKFLGSTTIAHGVSGPDGIKFYPYNEISRGQIAQLLKATAEKFL